MGPTGIYFMPVFSREIWHLSYSTLFVIGILYARGYIELLNTTTKLRGPPLLPSPPGYPLRGFFQYGARLSSVACASGSPLHGLARNKYGLKGFPLVTISAFLSHPRTPKEGPHKRCLSDDAKRDRFVSEISYVIPFLVDCF